MSHGRGRLPRLPVTTALLCLILAAPASGDETRFEITPFAAYRVSGTFDDADSDNQLELQESSAWGLVLNGQVETNTEWELLYARQSTDAEPSGLAGPGLFDIDIDYLHLGGTYLFDGERARPFIALTAGATRFEPNLPGFDAHTYFSMSLGAGWKFRLAEQVGLRFEARGFATLMDSNNRLFCESDGGGSCLIVIEGRLLTQWEARAGIALRF